MTCGEVVQVVLDATATLLMGGVVSDLSGCDMTVIPKLSLVFGKVNHSSWVSQE